MQTDISNVRLRCYLVAKGDRIDEFHAAQAMTEKPWIRFGSHISGSFMYREWIDAMKKVALRMKDEARTGVFSFDDGLAKIGDHDKFSAWMCSPEGIKVGAERYQAIYDANEQRYNPRAIRKYPEMT